MADLLAGQEPPVTVPEQIAAIEREIAMRGRVYPRWVAAGKMTQAKADHELRAMRAALDTLRSLGPPHASLAGALPLILYFPTEADRAEFIALVKEAKPGMAEFVIP